jgi:hypothetical protein
MKEITEFEVSIFQGKRAWYELLLAAIFYSAFIYMVTLTIYYGFIEKSVQIFIRAFVTLLICGTYSIAYGLRFSATKNLLIDVDTNSKVTEFEYVSFYEDRYGCFGTNLWYVKNKHYKMYSFENKEAAYQFALDISNKLNIDLLDATEKGNFQWIEKQNLNK